MSKLEPCPFCGAVYEKDDEDFYWSGEHASWCPIISKGDGVLVPDTKEAIDAWNTRHEQTCEIVGFTSAIRGSGGLIIYPPVWNLSCGHEAAWWKPRKCPICGTKVVE